MNTNQRCLICGGSTEVGFVLDRGDKNRRRPEEWWVGEPERSFWRGVKKPDRTYTIATLRCTKCGYLMEFAEEQTAGR
jgi:hypothetical protein